MPYAQKSMQRLIDRHLPGRVVTGVEDRGLWIRETVILTLDGGERVVVKVAPGEDGREMTEKEAWLCGLLAERGLPAPRTIAVDLSGEVVPHPAIIQEWVGGKKVGVLLAEDSGEEARAIYRALGRHYRAQHAIGHERSGWIYGPGHVAPLSPNDFMQKAVFEEHGARLVAEGRLDRATYERILRVTRANLDYLKAHRPALVAGFLPWTVYLERDGAGWRVAKLTDMIDLLWWDPAYDLASIKYPPFREHRPERWAAFLEGYSGPEPEERRLLLYVLMQRLNAAAGGYMEPETTENRAWRAGCLQEVPALLDRIEAH